MITAHSRTGPTWLHERIRAGETVIIDGATSTELQRRGVPMHHDAWSGAAMFEYGHVLQQVHESYISAGAEVVITNTFATSRQVLQPAGMGNDVARINREAVAIAQRARAAAASDHPTRATVAIAGSMSDFRPNADTPEWTNETTLRATFREQAHLLAEAGVDLLALEMMQEPEIAVPIIEEALATGLPVWVGVSCRIVPGQAQLALYDDEHRTLSECLHAVVGLGAGLINVMHSHVPATTRAIDEVRAVWDGPLGAYPNSGYFARPNWNFEDIIPPALFVEEALSWIERGVQIVGGCCGIGPEHIALLHQHLKGTTPPPVGGACRSPSPSKPGVAFDRPRPRRRHDKEQIAIMKIAVIGTGAMGSIYAGLLADAGNEVWAIDTWPEHVAAMRAQGLRVEGASGDRVVRQNLHATMDVADAGRCDLYVVATKAYDVAAAAQSLRPLVSGDALVLAMQNGLGAGEHLTKFLPADNVLLGIGGGFGASMRGPGHTHHNGMAMINIGELRGGLTERVQKVAATWANAGFNARAFENIDQLIWEKLICNCTFSAPCTVFGRTVRQMLDDVQTRKIALACGVEAWEIARARNIAITIDDPEPYLLNFASGVLDARPSMLQDHMAGRRSEIDFINGAIPPIAAQVGLSAPYNEIVSAIVRAREAEFRLNPQ